MVRSGSLLVLVAVATALLCAAPGDALALRTQQRPGWMVGIGWGMGRGVYTTPAGLRQEYSEGGIPLIRVGRMLGSKAMIALNYSGWLMEFDSEGPEGEGGLGAFASDTEDSTIIKSRRSQQQVALSFYWFPGNPQGASGGVYLRAGGGMGWSGTNLVPIVSGEPQGSGDRIDEWGWGLSAEGGYEFWISGGASLGGGVFYNYMSIRDKSVDDGWFAGAALNLNIYF